MSAKSRWTRMVGNVATLASGLLLCAVGTHAALAGPAEDAFQRKDYPTAFKLWSDQASSGNAFAASNIGQMYYDGTGTPKDHSLAARWFTQAAKSGVLSAATNLGTLYLIGDGVPQSTDQAASWYRIAADEGFPEAQARLGSLYREGRGVSKDLSTATDCWRLAAAGGNASAALDLAAFYSQEGQPRSDLSYFWAGIARKVSPQGSQSFQTASADIAKLAPQLSMDQIASTEKAISEWKISGLERGGKASVTVRGPADPALPTPPWKIALDAKGGDKGIAQLQCTLTKAGKLTGCSVISEVPAAAGLLQYASSDVVPAISFVPKSQSCQAVEAELLLTVVFVG